MKAELTMRLHPDGGGEVTLAMLDEVTSELTPGASTATAASRTAPDWSVAAGGAIAACGYLAGEVAGGGLSRLAGSLVIALALLVAFVVSTGSARLVIDGRQQVRCGIEMLGAMLFAAGAASAARV